MLLYTTVSLHYDQTMINLFRKIRHQLLTDNKFSKYLLYALGEIILVVIGILIAVQLNNANEKRKQRETIMGIYTIVAEDLQNDIRDINRIITRYDSLETIFVRVLEGSFTKQDYKTCDKCHRIIIGFPDLSLEQRGYKLLSNFNAIAIRDQDSLQMAIIQFYNKHLLEIEVDQGSRTMDLENNYMYWKNNHTWWSDFYLGKYTPAFIDYAVEDPDYKNRVATFYGDTYNVYLPELKAFKTEGNTIIDAIIKRNNSTN